MPVSGKLEEKRILRFREAMMSGEAYSLPCSVTKNIDNKVILVEFEDKPKVVYNVFDMIADAYQLLKEKGYISKEEQEKGEKVEEEEV